MHEHRHLSHLIDAHREAVLVDEASFDDDGNSLDAAQAEKTGNVERAAFIEFVSAPCTSPDDVQAKLRYLLDDTVGERDTHLDCLIDYGDRLLEQFLRSLLVEGVEAASRPSRAPGATHACACEEA